MLPVRKDCTCQNEGEKSYNGSQLYIGFVYNSNLMLGHLFPFLLFKTF